MNLPKRLLEKCLSGQGVSCDEAMSLTSRNVPIYSLLHEASIIRHEFFGNRISLCSIINAKSGLCPNNCAFCAQSVHNRTNVQVTGVISTEQVLKASETAAANGSINFGIVTSGAKLDKEDMAKVIQVASGVSANRKIGACASLGELDREDAVALYNAGIRTYHHNLETSEKFYPQVCSTYDYCKKLKTIETAKKAGLGICCGGIFGLGETWEDRIDMAMTIRSLGASSIPINFLIPVKGTPLESQPLLQPLEALRIIAIYRFIFPDKILKICGGREHILRDLQSWMFYAGANGTMVGDYLTTAGRPAIEDIQMLKDLGLEPAKWEEAIKC
jgi:biotin synthase